MVRFAAPCFDRLTSSPLPSSSLFLQTRCNVMTAIPPEPPRNKSLPRDPVSTTIDFVETLRSGADESVVLNHIIDKHGKNKVAMRLMPEVVAGLRRGGNLGSGVCVAMLRLCAHGGTDWKLPWGVLQHMQKEKIPISHSALHCAVKAAISLKPDGPQKRHHAHQRKELLSFACKLSKPDPIPQHTILLLLSIFVPCNETEFSEAKKAAEYMGLQPSIEGSMFELQNQAKSGLEVLALWGQTRADFPKIAISVDYMQAALKICIAKRDFASAESLLTIAAGEPVLVPSLWLMLLRARHPALKVKETYALMLSFGVVPTYPCMLHVLQVYVGEVRLRNDRWYRDATAVAAAIVHLQKWSVPPTVFVRTLQDLMEKTNQPNEAIDAFITTDAVWLQNWRSFLRPLPVEGRGAAVSPFAKNPAIAMMGEVV